MKKLYVAAKLIIDAYYPPEEFRVFIIYGPLGRGKSTYQFKVSVEVLKHIYKISEEEAWEMLKSLIIFHPSQFFEKIREIEENFPFKRTPVLNWDDAGLWLYAMDWRDPFIESFIKYLNVARTHISALLCSSPTPAWILKKLRHFPEAYNVKINLVRGQPGSWDRQARGYLHWLHPDMKHSGVRTIFIDYFKCKMPKQFYEWYKPLRDKYEDMALNLLKEKWEQIGKRHKAILLENYPELKTPSIKETLKKLLYK